MEIYEVRSNGNDYVFQVKHNFTKPCPVCGVPACGEENILWYEREEEMEAIIFDGSLLNVEIGTYLENNMNQSNYANLTSFLKDWNEHKGWMDSDYDGFILEIEDFLITIDLLNKNNEWLTNECLLAIKQLALDAKSLNLELKIVRG